MGGLLAATQSFPVHVALACSTQKNVLRTLIVKTIMRANGLILAEAKMKAGLSPPDDSSESSLSLRKGCESAET